MNGFFHCLTLTAYCFRKCTYRNGSNRVRYIFICKHWPKARIGSLDVVCRRTTSIVEFSQPLLDEAELEQQQLELLWDVRDNSKCVFWCSGVCTCSSSFFGYRVSVYWLSITWLLRSCFLVIFAPVFMLSLKSTHQRTNDDDDVVGGSVLRNISKNTSAEDTGGDCPG